MFGVLPEIVSEHCTDRILNNLRGYAKQAPKIIFLNFLPVLSQNVIVIRRTTSMRATEKFHRKVRKLKETIFQAGQYCCTDNKTTEKNDTRELEKLMYQKNKINGNWTIGHLKV